MIRNTLLIAAALLLSGCFAYIPVPPGTAPPQGTAVRAYLSRPGDYRLTDYTANNIVQIDGEIVRVNPDTLVLSAFGLQAASGFEFLGNGETVLVPRMAVGGLERKQLSVWRSAALGAVFAAVVTLGGFALAAAGGGSEGGGNGGQTR